MIAERHQASAVARDVAQKWRCAAQRGPARVRCGWALGTGAHPAVEAQLDLLTRKTHRTRSGEEAPADRARLLGEADIAAAIGQHFGLMVAKVAAPRGDDGAVCVRLRGAAGAITVTITRALWTLKEKGAAQLAVPFADLAPSWVGVALDAGLRPVELRRRRTTEPPPAWEQTIARAWRERLAAAREAPQAGPFSASAR